ncbi:MAG: hypothetical protein HC922_09395 [Leptolyngbyaceae cyanobacterium SM2_3_12]|nr:hypothetical protein [Leptolyngbyaceae cyanobacterium SM2_3_12]
MKGTYQLRGDSLGRGQRRQTRAFEIYLQRGDVKDQWVWVDPVTPS